MLAPVLPYLGVRGIDAWGAGGFGAPRDGGKRPHLGTDFITRQCPEKSLGIAVMDGVICHVGQVYGADENTVFQEETLGTIHIKSGDFYFKYYYAKALHEKGTKVYAGDTIGVAQTLIPLFREKDSSRDDITDHIHFEVHVRGADGEYTRVDPMRYVAEVHSV